MVPTRFTIDDAPAATARSRSSRDAAAEIARWLSWVELLLLMPTRLLGAFGWLLVPVLLLAVAPVLLLGALMLVQAPLLWVLWKLFGEGRPLGDGRDD